MIRKIKISYIFAMVICCSFSFLITSCDLSDISVKGANGEKYSTYQECCAANDFEAAYMYIVEMEKTQSSHGRKLFHRDFDIDYFDDEDIEKAKEYVFKSEALYLMSQDADAAKKRIVYLLKEKGGTNDHVSMLIDLAMENDDDAFVKTLANQYTEGVNEESLKKLIEFLTNKPTEENKIFAEKLISKHLSLSSTSLLNYLANKQDTKDSEMILGLLAEKEKNIPIRPALGLSKLDNEEPIVNYNTSIKDYNDGCKTILHVAIASKNQYLAQRVITKAKPNIAYTDLGDWCHVVEKQPKSVSSIYEAFKLSLDNSDVNSIKATYQEAVRSGAFK